MMKFCVYSNVFSNGKRDLEASSYEEACLWACAYCGEENCKVTWRYSRGGSRPGVSRPNNSAVTGKWRGEKTVAVRIPERIAKNITNLSEAYESISSLSKFFHSEAEKASQQSKTNTYPLTWDKALKLLQEIDEILQSEPYVV